MAKSENDLLLTLANIFYFSKEEKQSLKQKLVGNDYDWEIVQIFFQNHRVAPAIYYKLKQYELLPYLPRPVLDAVLTEYQTARSNYQRYWKKIKKLLSVSESSQHTCLLLKGEVLACLYYPDYGTRPFGDCDLLCTQDAIDIWCDHLKQLGYTQGYGEEGRIKSASRKERLFARLYMKHDIAYVKYENEDLYVFEPHHTIFWRKQDGRPAFDLPMNVLFQHSVEKMVDDIPVLHLSNEYFLLYLCIDIYEDANRVEKIAQDKDLDLIKFLDVYAVINSGVEWNEFVTIVTEYHMQVVIYYVLAAFVSLYPILPLNVLRALRPDDLSCLNEFGFPEELKGQEKGVYDRGFLDRFFDSSYRSSMYMEQSHKFKRTTFQELKTEGEG